MNNALRFIMEKLLPPVVFLLICYANYLVFLWVPTEQIMGPVQRIFYFHVGSAVACYFSFAIVFVASIVYLAKKNIKADIVSESAGEVGFVLCTIVLASGMIWGHAAWNTWFRWEPRLLTFLLLWLIFFGFNILRMFGDRQKIAAHSAVLGIIGAITVPIMIFSIKLLPQVAQLHPQVTKEGGLHPDMKYTMFVLMGTMVLFQFMLLWLRVRVGLLKSEKEY